MSEVNEVTGGCEIAAVSARRGTVAGTATAAAAAAVGTHATAAAAATATAVGVILLLGEVQP